MSGEHADRRSATGFGASWGDATNHALNSYVEANRAVLASLGLGDTSVGTTRHSPAITEVAHAMAGWSFERSVETREELGVGDYVRFSKPLRDEDLHAFADASGDTNRLHLDDEFAANTRFGGRVVHGTLVAGLISAALARLPGLTIYLSQDLEFRGPVRVGSTVTAECEIVADLGDDRYRLSTAVTTEDGETVIDGEAVVLIDELPDA